MNKISTEAGQDTTSELKEITIWSNPITTFTTLLLCIMEWLQQGWGWARRYMVFILSFLTLVIVPHVVHGPHSPVDQSD